MTPLPSWHAPLASAFSQFPGTGFQFATVDPVSHSPQCRTMSCTGIIAPDTGAGPLLLACTDVRTPKVSEIRVNPLVQIVWWFESTKEQFRISGTATVVVSPLRADYQAAKLPQGFDGEAKRVETFHAMPVYMSAYARPPWGTPLRDAPPCAEWPEVRVPEEGSTEEERRHYEGALRNFALVVVDPVVVDYRTARERVRFERTEDGEWKKTELVMQ